MVTIGCGREIRHGGIEENGVRIYCLCSVAGPKHGRLCPDTQSLRSFLRDDRGSGAPPLPRSSFLVPRSSLLVIVPRSSLLVIVACHRWLFSLFVIVPRSFPFLDPRSDSCLPPQPSFAKRTS